MSFGKTLALKRLLGAERHCSEMLFSSFLVLIHTWYILLLGRERTENKGRMPPKISWYSLDLDITMQSGKEFLFRSAERLGERCDLLLSGFKDTRLVSSLARFAHLSPCLSVIRTSLDLDFTVQSMKWEYASDTMYRRRCRISSRSISSMFPPVVWETETRW